MHVHERLPWPMLEPRALWRENELPRPMNIQLPWSLAVKVVDLTNEELQLCHFHVQIPANPDYSSLNLAMAVQTLSYEIRTSYLLAHMIKTYQERSTGNGSLVS